jgi:hypothetical protein
MQKSRSNAPAFHSYHYTVSAVAKMIGVPDNWIWAWLFARRLKSKKRAKCIWVRLGDVQTLFCSEKAVQEAYLATREPLSDPEAVRQVVGRWPDIGECLYFKPDRESGTLFCLEDEWI